MAHLILENDCDGAVFEANGWADVLFNDKHGRFEVGARVIGLAPDEVTLARLKRRLQDEFQGFSSYVLVDDGTDLVAWVFIPVDETQDGPDNLLRRFNGTLRSSGLQCTLIGSIIVPTLH